MTIRIPVSIKINKVTIDATNSRTSPAVVIEGSVGNDKLGKTTVTTRTVLDEHLAAILDKHLISLMEDDVAERVNGTILGGHLKVLPSQEAMADPA